MPILFVDFMNLGAKKIAKRWFCRVKLFLLSKYFRIRGYTPVHFLHIGKTGGTAIRAALSSVRLTPKKYVLIFHSHSVKLTDIPHGDKVVLFVRDPIDRFVSGFYSRQRQGRPRYNVPWTPSEREAFQQFKTPNQLGKALSSKDEGLRQRAVKAMKSIGHVRSSYRDWLISPSYLLRRTQDILFIGRQESLAKDFEVLKGILGIADDQVQLPSDPVMAHRNPDYLDKQLDWEARLNLKSWYAEDYQLLNILLNIRNEIMTNLGAKNKL